MAFNPKNIRYSPDGVPYFKAIEIEAIAYEVLEKYCPQNLNKPGITPVAEILEGLHRNTGLLMAWEDLGFQGEAKILGKVNFPKKTLYLDVILDGDLKPAFRFTAAHEIGHWVLHRHNWKNLRIGENQPTADEISDDEKSLCKLDQRTPRDWLEFHANVFAASLIMPKIPFQDAVVAAQKEMGIKRNLGTVFLSDADYSQRDFQELVSRLVLLFDVSRASIQVRLRTLRLLNDETVKAKTAGQSVASFLPRI